MASRKTSKDKGEQKKSKALPKPKRATKTTQRAKQSAGKSSKMGQVQRSTTADAQALALKIAEVGLDNKALNIEIIDVRGKVDYSDYIVVMSGRSDRQVVALANHVQQQLSKAGIRCYGLEGMPHGSWVLMDYGDVIVHVFHQDVRGYYDLESLWMDAARISLE